MTQRLYVPEHFKPDDAAVRELLRNHGAADLVTNTSNGLYATMLPLIYVEPDGSDATGELGLLVGHVARKNEQWRQPVLGAALAIIRGPDAYVSPTWYATKREHGRVVPTWNYITAHVHGELVVHDDAAWVEKNVRLLTARHERGREPAWDVDDAPADYVNGQLRAIVGLELRIARIEAKFKLGQNRSAADIAGAIEGLERDGDSETAAAMRAAQSSRERHPE